MDRTWTILCLGLFFIIFPPSCQGIECYQCNSKNHDNCTNLNVDGDYLQSCPLTHSYCRKVIYIDYFTGSSDYFVIRECAKSWSGEGECYLGQYPRSSYRMVCECKYTACNQSASHHQIHTFLNSLYLFILLSLINRYYQIL